MQNGQKVRINRSTKKECSNQVIEPVKESQLSSNNNKYVNVAPNALRRINLKQNFQVSSIIALFHPAFVIKLHFWIFVLFFFVFSGCRLVRRCVEFTLLGFSLAMRFARHKLYVFRLCPCSVHFWPLYKEKIQRKASWLVCLACCCIMFSSVHPFSVYYMLHIYVCSFYIFIFRFLFFCHCHCHCQSTIIIQSDRLRI